MNGIGEIIRWLLKVETLAVIFYKEASKRLDGNRNLSDNFLQLANEEAYHFRLMEDVLAYMQDHVPPPPAIIIDEKTDEKITGIFAKNLELLRSDSLSKGDLLRCLALAEFSEWNDIFMYVVNSVKEERKFMSVAAGMQHHISAIEDLLDSLPEGREHLKIVRSLPRVWKEQILIIEDDWAIASFLEKLFSDMARVETAVNGAEGLEKVKKRYFDVIISDVQMPLMDGIRFYRAAEDIDPKISQRIVFFTGTPKQEHIDFFQARQLRYLIKPAPIREIIKKVAEIMPSVNRE